MRVHVPAAMAGDARAKALALAADCIVAIGGGSAVGLAKAVALTEHLPIAAVPTTYAGSELTTVWGITEDGRKTTGKAPGVAPRLVVYDDPGFSCRARTGRLPAMGELVAGGERGSSSLQQNRRASMTVRPIRTRSSMARFPLPVDPSVMSLPSWVKPWPVVTAGRTAALPELKHRVNRGR